MFQSKFGRRRDQEILTIFNLCRLIGKQTSQMKTQVEWGGTRLDFSEVYTQRIHNLDCYRSCCGQTRDATVLRRSFPKTLPFLQKRSNSNPRDDNGCESNHIVGILYSNALLSDERKHETRRNRRPTGPIRYERVGLADVETLLQTICNSRTLTLYVCMMTVVHMPRG